MVKANILHSLLKLFVSLITLALYLIRYLHVQISCV